MTIFWHNVHMTAGIIQNLRKNLQFLRKESLQRPRESHALPCPISIRPRESVVKSLVLLGSTLSVSIEELLSAPRLSCLHVKDQKLKRQSRARGQPEW